ncbi:PREDICTED: aquaporin NIP1-2-like [Tarenaya hassleriana]|uniref:aquaporin NIP1-2-like n=1 Tax=Tarenaya hassleriana TaxID=28532 RepID=UPI00053C3795|nr:PREDICTED: aquaporin NIP1-2-like [Tarenaya hassleriana]
MAENSGNSHGGGGGRGSVKVSINEEEAVECRVDNDNTIICTSAKKQESLLSFSVPFLQKLIAEVFGTYFLIFAGCAAVAVNAQKDKVVTVPGISIVWGLAVTVLVYSVGHISGAHFNPAVTIAFASCRRFPFKQVPAYVIAQLLGSTLAAVTLRLMFDIHDDVCSGKHDVFVGTLPSGSNLQSLAIEFIITFYLMFVISGVATDNRAIGELAGLAVGATVLINVMFAGPVSGASMNPARTLGPAMVFGCYRGIWVYMVGPILGAVSAAWIYNMVRYTDKPLREITKSASFLKGSRSSR